MREIYLVARREYLAYVMAWGFWVSLVTTPLLMAAFAVAPTLLRNAEPARVVTILAGDPADRAAITAAFEDHQRARVRVALRLAAQTAGDDTLEAASDSFDAAPDTASAIEAANRVLAGSEAPAFTAPPPAYVLVDSPAVDAAGLEPYLTGQRQVVVAGERRTLFAAFVVRRDAEAPTLEYWSENVTDSEPREIGAEGLTRRLRSQALAERGLEEAALKDIEKLEAEITQFRPGAEAKITSRDRAPVLVGMLLAFVLWSSVLSISNMLLTGVIEEKSNKILDSLLTSLAPVHILAGKLLGVALVSLTMFSIWGALGAGILLNAAQGAGGLLGGAVDALSNPEMLIIFGVSFVLGYVLYGVLYLAVGSLCETLNEAQSLISPMFLIMLAPMLLLAPALNNADAPVVVAASWFPLFTPFLLILRAGSGLTLLEAAPPLILTAITAMIVLVLAGRVFRAGATGRLSIADVRRILPGARPKAAKA